MEKEVARGMFERGPSPWGSPPFPTKEFAEHRQKRKRRLVVDYRRVNARTLRDISRAQCVGSSRRCGGECMVYFP